MEHVEATATVAVDPDMLWGEIGRFQGIGAWHPMLAEVTGEGEQPGARRQATGKDGNEQVERLTEADPRMRYYRYVTETTPLRVSDYSAELRVRPGADGTSTIRWSADFDPSGNPPETTETTTSQIRDFLEAGMRALEDRYG